MKIKNRKKNDRVEFWEECKRWNAIYGTLDVVMRSYASDLIDWTFKDSDIMSSIGKVAFGVDTPSFSGENVTYPIIVDR